MTIKKSVLRRLGAPVRGGAAGREIEDELQFHIELRTRDNIAAGMAPEDAAADAMRRFGDFDQIRSVCEEIRKERSAGVMKLIKGSAWVILGCGLILKMSSRIFALQNVGDFLILIAVLWRLLIYLREMQSERPRGLGYEPPPLSVIHTIGDLSASGSTEDAPRPVPTYDKDGRTPVERLISDESPDGAVK
jgi:hypothetical protein